VNNHQLRQRTAADIDEQVDKILRGLGNPEPPLRIQDVRELLRLDTEFYSTTDSGIFREMFSRAYVGAQQIFARPTLLFEALAKLDLRALWIPDRRRILIDSALPPIKHRWAEAHEITHSVLPWHDDALFGDTKQTLAPHCHEHLEGEANYGAGRLLFLGNRFAAEAADYPLTLDTVRTLAKQYGNTITSTLWRLIEQLGTQRPLVGMVTLHPKRMSGNEEPCRYFIRSSAFINQYPAITERDLLGVVGAYCMNRRQGDLGSAHIFILDGGGERHIFEFQTFYNGYDALTLGVYLQPTAIIHTVA
jgi:IrrE N-terminal-like domain